MNSLLELAECWAAAPRILILEDDPDVTKMLGTMLGQYDCEIVAVARVDEAVGALSSSRFDIAFVDLKLPEGEGSGVDLIRYVKRHVPSLPIVVITGLVFDTLIDQALGYGVIALLRKPLDANLTRLRETLSVFKVRLRERIALPQIV